MRPGPRLALALLALTGCAQIGASDADHDLPITPDSGAFIELADASPTVDAAGACEYTPFAPGPRLHILYLVPSDRAVDETVRGSLEQAARAGVEWLRNEVGGRTLRLGDPVVDVIETDHPAAWYANNPAPGCDAAGRFQCNVESDAAALVGALSGDPDDLWVVYVDADPTCDQRTVARPSLAVAPANDLRGIAGYPLVTCDGSTPPSPPRCRWVGGLMWLTLYALGMPRTPGCADADAGTPCDPDNLLQQGFLRFPAATLESNQIGHVMSSTFVGPAEPAGCPLACSM